MADEKLNIFQKAWQWVCSLSTTPHTPEERYSQRGWLGRLFDFLSQGQVSRVHLYEAQDRYLRLLNMVESYEKVPSSGVKENSGEPGSEERAAGGVDEKTTKEPNSEMRRQKEAKRDEALQKCRCILERASVLLTRRQEDLNYLWRELTRVHILLVEKVLPERELPGQLDFCREEAVRTATRKDPQVSEMIQHLAEVMDERAENLVQKKRSVVALLERFTTVRTDRIHQQFVNIRTYKFVLLILIPVSVLMISNKDVLLLHKGDCTSLQEQQNSAQPGSNLNSNASTQGVQTAARTDLARKSSAATPGNPTGPTRTGEVQGGWWSNSWVGDVCRGLCNLLATNILAFVFFAGFAGGAFSVAKRLRERELVPGEDAYFMWYVLTKPFVGALGAMILFVLVQADYVSFDALSKIIGMLRLGQHGPEVFGFGFLAGFTERLVFPYLH